MIRFKNGEPTGLFYSQHDGGASFDWNDHTVSKKDEIRVCVWLIKCYCLDELLT
jgi:hypothetical protein